MAKTKTSALLFIALAALFVAFFCILFGLIGINSTPVHANNGQPTNLSAHIDTSLSSISLPDSWAWDNPNTQLTMRGTHYFSATYTATLGGTYISYLPVFVLGLTPTYTLPSPITAVFGDSTNDITLPDGWQWRTPIFFNLAIIRYVEIIYSPTNLRYRELSRNILVLTAGVPHQTGNQPVGVAGNTLATIPLLNNWAWSEPDLVLSTAGIMNFYATFTPTDTTFMPVQRAISVLVHPALEYTVPAGVVALTDTLLSSIDLPTRWEWVTPNARTVIAGRQTFQARFTPENVIHSEIIRDVQFYVVDADTAPIGLSGVSGQPLSSITLPASWAWYDSSLILGTGTVNFSTVVFTPPYPEFEPFEVFLSIILFPPYPPYTLPAGLTAYLGDTLYSVFLPSSWVWSAPHTVLDVYGVSQHPATFSMTGFSVVTRFIYVDVRLPLYILPTNLVAQIGNTLGDVTLPDGWDWADSTITLNTLGEWQFLATFFTTQYGLIERELTVTVLALLIPDYTIPTNLTVTVGNTLGSVALTAGWGWVVPSEILNQVGTVTHYAFFIPQDESRYTAIMRAVTIEVMPLRIPPVQIPTMRVEYSGVRLGDIALPYGWVWENPYLQLDFIGTQSFAATFTPSDTANYQIITYMIAVNLLSPNNNTGNGDESNLMWLLWVLIAVAFVTVLVTIWVVITLQKHKRKQALFLQNQMALALESEIEGSDLEDDNQEQVAQTAPENTPTPVMFAKAVELEKPGNSTNITISCDTCGGTVKHINGVHYKCEYCSSMKYVQLLSEHELTLLLQADINRTHHMQFETALDLYESILQSNPNNINAHWGMFLAEYGIEYVEEYGRYKPTFHRLSHVNVQNNPNFIRAMALATLEQRTQFEQEGIAIEQLREQSIEKSRKIRPFDIFICYKKTNPETGELTPEATWAQDYYVELRAMGYNVFWADKSIEGGEEYEPTIFNALSTSKFMLILTSDATQLNSKWVINEWGRFLKRSADGANVGFLVMHGSGVEPYTLPRKLQRVQALEHGKPRTFENLLSAISRYI